MGFLHDEFFISLPNEKQGVSAAAAKKTQWQDRAVLMWRIAAPIILLLGYAGNTLTIILLRRMKKQSAVYVYFGLLAVSDITNLTIGLLPRWVGHQFGYWIEDESKFACVALNWAGYSSGLFSTGLLVAVTVYRAACVVMPFRVHETCNSRTVSLTVVTLVVADTAFNSFVPFVIDYSADGCRWKKKYQEGLRPTLGCINAALYSFIPSVMIIISNVFLVWGLLQSFTTQESTRQHTFKIVAVMLVSVCFVFFTVPTSVVRIVDYSDPTLKESGSFKFLYDSTLILYYLNNAVNFYLYLCTGRFFRAEVKRLFTREGADPLGQRRYAKHSLPQLPALVGVTELPCAADSIATSAEPPSPNVEAHVEPPSPNAEAHVEPPSPNAEAQVASQPADTHAEELPEADLGAFSN
ncbi:hypothetical protein BaRGS_00028450, partial [Batillaria attramentaria]